MRIKFIHFQNFRKLKSTRIDFSKETTLFVGANNSGKTSAIDGLKLFLINRTGFSSRDFTLSSIPGFVAIGEKWESNKVEEPDFADWLPHLPS